MMLTGFHSPSAPRRAGYRARNTTREEPSLACAVVPQSFRTYMSTCHVGQSINLIGRLDLRWNDLTKKTNIGDRIWKIVCIFEWYAEPKQTTSWFHLRSPSLVSDMHQCALLPLPDDV